MNHLMYMPMRLVVNPQPYTTAQRRSKISAIAIHSPLFKRIRLSINASYTLACFVTTLTIGVQQNCVRKQQLVITDNLRLQTIREYAGCSFPKSCSPQLQLLLACSICLLHLQGSNMPIKINIEMEYNFVDSCIDC